MGAWKRVEAVGGFAEGVEVRVGGDEGRAVGIRVVIVLGLLEEVAEGVLRFVVADPAGLVHVDVTGLAGAGHEGRERRGGPANGLGRRGRVVHHRRQPGDRVAAEPDRGKLGAGVFEVERRREELPGGEGERPGLVVRHGKAGADAPRVGPAGDELVEQQVPRGQGREVGSGHVGFLLGCTPS